MNCGVGGSQNGEIVNKDPYMKEETNRMLCELQRPFTKALVDLLPDEPFEWTTVHIANSDYSFTALIV